jgi:hypothetical protein
MELLVSCNSCCCKQTSLPVALSNLQVLPQHLLPQPRYLKPVLQLDNRNSSNSLDASLLVSKRCCKTSWRASA